MRRPTSYPSRLTALPSSLALLRLATLQAFRLAKFILCTERCHLNLQVAIDLKLADKFLGDIVFARSDWTVGYRFANGYVPGSQQLNTNVAVFFSFNGFDFRMEQQEIRLANINFDVRVIPLATETSAEGGHRADLSTGHDLYQFEENARHVGRSIGYYRNEKILERAFAYGEVAAFFRGLKASGIDLSQLARAVQTANGSRASLTFAVQPEATQMRKPIDNLFDAWKRVDLNAYLAQWAPEAVKYEKGTRKSYAEIRRGREDLFPRVYAADAAYVTFYRGYKDGVGRFDVKYRLVVQLVSGKRIDETECEIYKVRRQGGRWVIAENHDYVPCEQITRSLEDESKERERRMERHWSAYLRAIQGNNRYANWSAPPYDLFARRVRQ